MSTLDSADPSTVVAGASRKVTQEEGGADPAADSEPTKTASSEDSSSKSPKEETNANGSETISSDAGDEGDDINDIADSRTFLVKVSCRSTSIHWLELSDYDSTDTTTYQGTVPTDPHYHVMAQASGMDPTHPMAPQYYPHGMGYAAQQHQSALQSRQQYFFQIQQHQQQQQQQQSQQPNQQSQQQNQQQEQHQPPPPSHQHQQHQEHQPPPYPPHPWPHMYGHPMVPVKGEGHQQAMGMPGDGSVQDRRGPQGTMEEPQPPWMFYPPPGHYPPPHHHVMHDGSVPGPVMMHPVMVDGTNGHFSPPHHTPPQPPPPMSQQPVPQPTHTPDANGDVEERHDMKRQRVV